MNLDDFTWTRQPQDYTVHDGVVTITTKPFTDLWQRTYYHFRNDNAPCSRPRRMSGISVSWSKRTSPKAIIASTSAAS